MAGRKELEKAQARSAGDRGAPPTSYAEDQPLILIPRLYTPHCPQEAWKAREAEEALFRSRQLELTEAHSKAVSAQGLAENGTWVYLRHGERRLHSDLTDTLTFASSHPQVTVAAASDNKAATDAAVAALAAAQRESASLREAAARESAALREAAARDVLVQRDAAAREAAEERQRAAREAEQIRSSAEAAAASAYQRRAAEFIRTTPAPVSDSV